MNEFERRVLEDLSALKVQMHQLMGVGQPGRVQALEERVATHERALQRVQGVTGALGSVLAMVQLVFFVLRGRH